MFALAGNLLACANESYCVRHHRHFSLFHSERERESCVFQTRSEQQDMDSVVRNSFQVLEEQKGNGVLQWCTHNLQIHSVLFCKLIRFHAHSCRENTRFSIVITQHISHRNSVRYGSGIEHSVQRLIMGFMTEESEFEFRYGQESAPRRLGRLWSTSSFLFIR
jgi:hypothetical protein